MGRVRGIFRLKATGQFGRTLLSLSYSRSVEARADQSAIATLAAAHVDSAGFEHVMRRFAAPRRLGLTVPLDSSAQYRAGECDCSCRNAWRSLHVARGMASCEDECARLRHDAVERALIVGGCQQPADARSGRGSSRILSPIRSRLVVAATASLPCSSEVRS